MDNVENFEEYMYHGFMPIAVEAVSLDKYLSWLDS